MKKNLYTNICVSRNFIWGFNQGDYNHHNLNICSINWSLVSHQMPLQAVSILGIRGNGLTQHGNQMLCQHSVGSSYKMKSKFQQTIMEQRGEAQLRALMPAEEAEVQKTTDYLFCLLVCLFEIWFHYIYQVIPELTVLLFQTPKYWNYRREPPQLG